MSWYIIRGFGYGLTLGNLISISSLEQYLFMKITLKSIRKAYFLQKIPLRHLIFILLSWWKFALFFFPLLNIPKRQTNQFSTVWIFVMMIFSEGKFFFNLQGIKTFFKVYKLYFCFTMTVSKILVYIW